MPATGVLSRSTPEMPRLYFRIGVNQFISILTTDILLKAGIRRAEPFRARSMGLCLGGHHPVHSKGGYSHSPGQVQGAHRQACQERDPVLRRRHGHEHGDCGAHPRGSAARQLQIVNRPPRSTCNVWQGRFSAGCVQIGAKVF